MQLAAATFLLSNHENLARKALENISKSNSFHAFNAEMTLQQWDSGELHV